MIAEALRDSAKSAVKPEKLSTTSEHSLLVFSGRISLIMSHRSSTENRGRFSGLFRTAMTISSKSGELRLMISRCPLVGGSKEPGKIALRIRAYAVKQKGNILGGKPPQ